MEAPSAILYRNGYEPTSALMTQANMAISQRHQQRGQLILVILPDTSSDCYKEVKFESDCKLGVPSQCLLAQKANIGTIHLVVRLEVLHASMRMSICFTGKEGFLVTAQSASWSITTAALDQESARKLDTTTRHMESANT